ncbi:MAG: translation initiation factor [Phycisphaeraceae bacterium]|nr:translation initiation factor [Phycisphaeraceae bacterium]
MAGLFDGTALERPVTCEVCGRSRDACSCPRDAAGRVCRPRDQVARIALERRRGHEVTVVRGLDPVATDLRALVRSMRTTCSTGGTVTADGLELQGDHRGPVAAALRSAGFGVKGG